MKNINWFDNIEPRAHPWPGLNWMTPGLVVLNVKSSINFYHQAFGIVPIFELPNDKGEIVFARLRYRGSNFTLSHEGFDSDLPAPIANSDIKTPLIMYLYLDDVKSGFDKAVTLGAKVIQEPKLEFWGDLRARIKSPDGYVWDIAQKV